MTFSKLFYFIMFYINNCNYIVCCNKEIIEFSPNNFLQILIYKMDISYFDIYNNIYFDCSFSNNQERIVEKSMTKLLCLFNNTNCQIEKIDMVNIWRSMFLLYLCQC